MGVGRRRGQRGSQRAVLLYIMTTLHRMMQWMIAVTSIVLSPPRSITVLRFVLSVPLRVSVLARY